MQASIRADCLLPNPRANTTRLYIHPANPPTFTLSLFISLFLSSVPITFAAFPTARQQIQSFSIIPFRTTSHPFTMKYINASAIMALLTLEAGLISASLDARQVPIAKWTLEGYSNFGTPYPSYNVSVPEDGVVYPISASSPTLTFHSIYLSQKSLLREKRHHGPLYPTSTNRYTPHVLYH